MTESILSAEYYTAQLDDFVGIATAHTVYIGVKNRADFDKLDLPVRDSGETASGHVLSKSIWDAGETKVTVVFQHWVKQLTYAGICVVQDAKKAAKEAAKAEAGAE